MKELEKQVQYYKYIPVLSSELDLTAKEAYKSIPALVLVLFALPSLQILYVIEEVDKPDLTLKATGHQWY